MIQKGTCQAEILLPTFNTGSGSTDIRYWVPFSSNPITGTVVVNGGMTIPQIQTLLDNDPTRITSGYTVTVVSFDGGGLTVYISKSSTTKIASIATGRNAENPLVESPFVCNLRKKKKNNAAFVCPPSIDISVTGNPLPQISTNCGIYRNPTFVYSSEKSSNIYRYYKLNANGSTERRVATPFPFIVQNNV